MSSPTFPAFTIRYKDGSNKTTVRVVMRYNRGDLSGPIMSASSGPKDYVRNQAWQKFQDDPALESILIVNGAQSSPFALFYRSGQYYDAAGQVVNMEPR